MKPIRSRPASKNEILHILNQRKSGVSRVDLAAITGIPYQTIAAWERRSEYPSTPKKRGRKCKLSSKQACSLYEALDRDDSLSNEELVEQLKLPIKPQSVSNYLKRAEPPFTRKKR
jgi:transposase